MSELTEVDGTIVFERSPYGNIDAIVDSDGRTVYFYLNGDEAFGTRACWVQNLEAGPLVLNHQELQAGRPPMLSRLHTVDALKHEKPIAEDLQVVWFAEGNGAALMEKGEAVAVIPPWSGLDGFHGYAKNCAAENEICWPMPNTEALTERISASQTFWQDWENGALFQQIQPALLNLYEKHFGVNQKYFSIDGGHFPTRGLGLFERDDRLVLATVGMSLCPMPNVELHHEFPRMHRRIELAVALERTANEELLEQVAKRMSGIASMPWRRWIWFGERHTCDWLAGSETPIAELRRDAAIDIQLPEVQGDPVHLLWLVPKTEKPDPKAN